LKEGGGVIDRVDGGGGDGLERREGGVMGRGRGRSNLSLKDNPCI